MSDVNSPTGLRYPTMFAIIGIFWWSVLLVVLWLRWKDVGFLGDLENPFAGVMPLIVPWAGALGGVTVSLMGTAKHSRDWDTSWNVWHAIRPVMGMVAGTVGFVAVVIVLRVAGGLKDEDTVVTLNPVSNGLFFVLAFVIGFRDKVFLELVGKVAQVLFANGEQEQEEFAYALDVAVLDFGDVEAGTSQHRRLRARISAGDPGELEPEWWRIEPEDAPFTATATDDEVALGRVSLRVTFAPSGPGPARARLVTTIGGVEHSVRLKGKGTRGTGG